jgi:branched-chain amino acid transport system permease protein
MLPTPKGVYVLAAGAVLLALLPFMAHTYYIELATSALVAAMLALSLQLLVGCTGLVSLGHGAFYGLAAYTVYLVTPENAGLSIFITLPLAIITAGVAALLVGALSLRTRGFFFLMVTLAFGQMIFFVFHDTKLGGGTDGAYLARPLLSFLGLELTYPRRQRPVYLYYVALVQLVAMYLFLVFLLRSLFGRVLEGIRVNEHRMRALGYDTYRYKLAAFVIAGALAGVAGHMWAMHRAFVNPELVGWHRAADVLLMLLLGGLQSLHGPILGALAFTGLGELPQLIRDAKPFARFFASLGLDDLGLAIQALAERKLLLEGLVILAVVLALPRGLASLGWPRFIRPAYGRDPAGKAQVR